MAEPPQVGQMTSSQRQQLLKTCKAAIDTFLASKSPFRVISTISGGVTSFSVTPSPQPRTLFILDSSFNPPSAAHASLALSAIKASDAAPTNRNRQSEQRYPSPVRLLLLFSTHNADKEAKPAAFEHRLAMMIIFARNLSQRLHDTHHQNQQTTSPENSPTPPAIDIGLITEPYYHRKTAAIAAAAASSPPDQPATQHVHLTGFDTVTRIFSPKYYADYTPPLSALAPYFAAGHALRVTARPSSPSGADSDDDETQAQLRWPAENLASGALEAQGGAREWAERVEMVEADAEGRDVSSTRVRDAVVRGDWADVGRCCTEGVVEWIREFGLYAG